MSAPTNWYCESHNVQECRVCEHPTDCTCVACEEKVHRLMRSPQVIPPRPASLADLYRRGRSLGVLTKVVAYK